MQLSNDQLQRARGVLVGTACGDALGAPLEFGPVVPYPAPIAMTGGRGWRPGEWTDDTSMAIIIARAAVEHGTLADGSATNAVASGFHGWALTAPDVGIQTRHVLGSARPHGVNAAQLSAAAREYASTHERVDGNGSLMRTAPVALAYLHDVDAMVDRARAVSALTHAGDDSMDACVLWCNAIRVAVLDGTLEGLHAGLDLLEPARRDLWAQRLAVAEVSEPWDFTKNGWAVHALQAAWAAVHCSAMHEGAPEAAFERGIDHAVRCGNDTDTVGAIAGGLLGGVHGLDAVPAAWLETLNGWPNITGADLVSLTDSMLTLVTA